MRWEKEKSRWPHADVSRFVETKSAVWHLQQYLTPDLPHILMLHGSGATTHSFAGLCEALREKYSITLIDLPGHGFTTPLNNQNPTIDNVCDGLSEVLEQENIRPNIIVGHSAGAAIATHLVHLNVCSPAFITSINGAFFPFPGFAGHIFPAAAKLLFLNPFVPKLFAFTSSEQSVERLLTSTGSRLRSDQMHCYRRAFQSSHHVEGTLAMMANWDLHAMADELANLDIPMLQIIGARDGTIKPSASEKVEALLKDGTKHVFKNAGHLVHEELPREVGEKIADFTMSAQGLKMGA